MATTEEIYFVRHREEAEAGKAIPGGEADDVAPERSMSSTISSAVVAQME